MVQEKREWPIVTLLGVAVCLVAGILDFASFKENRLAKGVGYTLFDAVSPVYTWLLIVLCLLVLIIIFAKLPYLTRHTIVSFIGYALLLGVLISLPNAARTLLRDAEAFSRVSVGPGGWLMLLGGYIVASSSAKHLQSRTIQRILPITLIACITILAATGFFDSLSVVQELMAKRSRFFQEFANHLSIAFTSVAMAMIIGIPLGVMAYRRERAEKPVFYIVNTAQTIPSLALFGLLIAPLSFLANQFPALRALGVRGIGTTPALIALTLYALLPITRNTYTSLKVLDPAIVQAGKGMGLGRLQLLTRIEIPLAAPVMLNGLRLATIQAIGNTTVAALIGAGGFGFFIFQGLGQAAEDLILLGAIPVVMLAVTVDRSLQFIISLITPEGLRKRAAIEGGVA